MPSPRAAQDPGRHRQYRPRRGLWAAPAPRSIARPGGGVVHYLGRRPLSWRPTGCAGRDSPLRRRYAHAGGPGGRLRAAAIPRAIPASSAPLTLRAKRTCLVRSEEVAELPSPWPAELITGARLPIDFGDDRGTVIFLPSPALFKAERGTEGEQVVGGLRYWSPCCPVKQPRRDCPDRMLSGGTAQDHDPSTRVTHVSPGQSISHGRGAATAAAVAWRLRLHPPDPAGTPGRPSGAGCSAGFFTRAYALGVGRARTLAVTRAMGWPGCW